MHEFALMTEAVRLAAESAHAAGAQRITELRLRVGTLSGTTPAALEFVWDVVRQKTMAAQARLEIECVPAVAWCAQCQTEFMCECWVNECPRCHSPGVQLRHGQELEIAAVELE